MPALLALRDALNLNLAKRFQRYCIVLEEICIYGAEVGAAIYQ